MAPLQQPVWFHTVLLGSEVPFVQSTSNIKNIFRPKHSNMPQSSCLAFFLRQMCPQFWGGTDFDFTEYKSRCAGVEMQIFLMLFNRPAVWMKNKGWHEKWCGLTSSCAIRHMLTLRCVEFLLEIIKWTNRMRMKLWAMTSFFYCILRFFFYWTRGEPI